MAFQKGDAGGWDECLPSVAPCTVETAAGLADIPDHGDVWRVAWHQVDANGSVTLRVNCFSLPLALERSIHLHEDRQKWCLTLDYKLSNTGDFSVPWSWSAHPLFATEPGDHILLPASITKLRLEGSGGDRLGIAGNTVEWPIAVLADGSRSDLSLVQSPESHIGDKVFAGPLSANENWCALYRPRAGVRIKMSFDPIATPYLGLWICHGGWPDGPGPKQTCVALEPSTAPVDSLAVTGPWSRVLAPGECFTWTLAVDFEKIQV
ncbi:MAG TPA: aldose epimerase [Terracidiphilus sp.]|nr:aldose epimerase [Terracidiphilus sp.]